MNISPIKRFQCRIFKFSRALLKNGPGPLTLIRGRELVLPRRVTLSKRFFLVLKPDRVAFYLLKISWGRSDWAGLIRVVRLFKRTQVTGWATNVCLMVTLGWVMITS